MAYCTFKFFSNSLVRGTTFEMLIPNDPRADIPREETEYDRRGMKTLFLLHGYTGSAGDCIPAYLAEKYNFAVIMPNGENGFWLDGLSTGHKFATFVGSELVEYVRKTFGLAKTPDDTYIMGLSMGGFGALHTALAYPQTFGKAAALSSAFIVHDIAGMKPGENSGPANYDYYHECFGDLDKVLESDANPEVLAKRLVDEHKHIPEIFMSCGTEDFLLENNRRMHRFLEDIGVRHVYIEDKGAHDMDFWSRYFVKFTEAMFA